jgi:hypothetical protein
MAENLHRDDQMLGSRENPTNNNHNNNNARNGE